MADHFQGAIPTFAERAHFLERDTRDAVWARSSDLSSADPENLLILDKKPLYCSTHEQICHVIGDDGLKLTFDYGHYTPSGNRFYARQIERYWSDAMLDFIASRATAPD